MSSLSVRLNVFKSVEDVAKQRGKVVLAGATLADTLLTASESLGEAVVALRSSLGALVTDINVLRDWDVVIAVTESAENFPVDGETTSGTSSPFAIPSHLNAARDTSHDVPDFTLRKTTHVPSPDGPSRSDWVRLNVGGRVFATTRATLSSDPDSMLARMFEPSEVGWLSATDASGAFLIDRSPTFFEPLLNFMRHGRLILNEGISPLGVLEEAKFFGISKAIEPLEALVRNEELSASGHFTRKEFLHFLASTSSAAPLRCQGLNLEGLDLSNLDLRNINFKCANLRYCNLSCSDLSHCVFERADLFQANLNEAVVQCVHMPRANLEGATLKGCHMGERLGVQTNLEGANLKGTMFDNSQMNGVNLRLASLRGASLRSCNLRYAVMACTDLENCDLGSSDLQHANLRGANLETTNFQDIVV
jgi:uncharacterized protein YjbI with pentapeptide repeats